MTIETLKAYGLEELTDAELRHFLMNQPTGILGLPSEEFPYLLPMTFSYDGESSLYFTYFVDEPSRKVTLTEAADTASFLVYSYTSVFCWESALLSGKLEQLEKEEWENTPAATENEWHLSIFDMARTAGERVVYRFSITEKTGIKATGLPPGMEEHHGYE